MKISIEHENPLIVSAILTETARILFNDVTGEPDNQAPGFTFQPAQDLSQQLAQTAAQNQTAPAGANGATGLQIQPVQTAPATTGTRKRRTKEQIAADEAAEAAAKAAGVPALQPVPDVAPPVQQQTAPNFGQQPTPPQFDPAQNAIYGQQQQYQAPAQTLPPPVTQAPAGPSFLDQATQLIQTKWQEGKAEGIQRVMSLFRGPDGNALQRVSEANPNDLTAIVYNLSQL